jgi:hypothetical protein
MAGSRLFIVGSNGSLLTISPYDGKVIDRRALDARITLPPIVAGGTIYLLDDDGNLSAYR